MRGQGLTTVEECVSQCGRRANIEDSLKKLTLMASFTWIPSASSRPAEGFAGMMGLLSLCTAIARVESKI